MKTKDFALEVKNLTEEGTFEGYGSVFGNLDSYGERVMPGAFAKSLARHAKEKTSPLMLWQHNPDYPIGVWDELAEDKKGLFGRGRLLKGVQKADEAHIIMQNGAIRGLSIGYRVIKSEPDGNNLNLVEVDLYEISPVTFAANEKARITAVKSSDRMEEFARKLRDGEPMPVKEFEDILRDAGVPRALATQIASVGYAKAIRSESEGVKATDLAALREAVSAFLPNAP